MFDGNDALMEKFLAEICSQDWNEEQDAGRSFDEGVKILIARHPEHAEMIHAYHHRWEEMLAGPIPETVKLLSELRALNWPLYALTNWNSDKFKIALGRYDFLGWFREIVVSGDVGLKKPDPQIFKLLLKRCGLDATSTLFIDDSAKNVASAESLGFKVIHFTSPAALRQELARVLKSPRLASE
jgi:2-haloacid dehalogenase